MLHSGLEDLEFDVEADRILLQAGVVVHRVREFGVHARIVGDGPEVLAAEVDADIL